MNNSSSRTQNTKRNIIASYAYFVVQIIFQFASRSIIVYTLGEQYLGLSSLFTSILQVLNMAEMGFSTTIIYNMYKPIADGDVTKIRALLAFYRKIYKIIGAVVLGVGLAVTPFLGYLIKGTVPHDINLYILYILYLLNTSISYFLFAHKTALLSALQRLDITKIVTMAVTVCQYVLQLIALLVFKNYYLFVICLVLGTASTNVFNAVISRKKYPEYYCEGQIDTATKKDISYRIKGLLICNVSGVTYTSFDSIILSAFIGLTSVAIYNNYITIFNAVCSCIVLIRQSMQASVGNSVVSESVEKNYKDMLLWQFLFSCIATWCASCMISLYQPFMKIWMGENMMLPMIDVLLLGFWLMVSVVQHAFYLYLSANGLWNELKWTYITSTILNLILNILLGRWIGITGVIIASVTSTFVCGLVWQCSLILKIYFKRSAWGYLLRQFGYFGIAFIICFITYWICQIPNIEGFPGLGIKAVICLVVPSVLIILAYFKTEQFKSAKQLFIRVLKNK